MLVIFYVVDITGRVDNVNVVDITGSAELRLLSIVISLARALNNFG